MATGFSELLVLSPYQLTNRYREPGTSYLQRRCELRVTPTTLLIIEGLCTLIGQLYSKKTHTSIPRILKLLSVIASLHNIHRIARPGGLRHYQGPAYTLSHSQTNLWALGRAPPRGTVSATSWHRRPFTPSHHVTKFTRREKRWLQTGV